MEPAPRGGKLLLNGIEETTREKTFGAMGRLRKRNAEKNVEIPSLSV
jgi:hypothetical protein